MLMLQYNTEKVDREYVECRFYCITRGSLNWGEIVQGCSSKLLAQQLYI